MNILKLKINENALYWGVLLLLVLLVFIRLFFYNPDSVLFNIVNDFLVLVSIAAVTLQFIKKFRITKSDPSSLVFNAGILALFVFLLLFFSENILGIFSLNIKANAANLDFFENLAHTAYSVLLLLVLCYWLALFWKLHFYKGSEHRAKYFTMMLLFIFLTVLSELLFNKEETAYVSKAFFIISVVLISLNSAKISWIAFINKKEKVSLLFLSIIISALFIFILISISEDKFNGKLLSYFSAGFQEYFVLVSLYGGIYFTVLFFTTLFHIPTAEAYDRKAAEVLSLQYFSKLITQVIDFDDLAKTVTDIAINVSNAESAWILMLNDDGLIIHAPKNISSDTANIINSYLQERGLFDKINHSNCLTHEISANSYLDKKARYVALTPLKSFNKITGYLIALRVENDSFNEDDKMAFSTFSDYASVAIENSLLLEQSIEKERLEKELDVARDIQRRILPAKDPEINNLQITTTFIPAFEVGGDYYDFFEIDKNNLGFVIADVSGKGISAAFIMAEVKGIFSSLSRIIVNPRDILTKTNEILNRTLNRKNFVSALYGILNFEENSIKFARAGHCPALLIRNREVQIFKPQGLGLGLAGSDKFNNNLEEIKINLKESDIFVFYTDGITEAKNNNFEDFGEKRLIDSILKYTENDTEIIANKVMQDVSLFSSTHYQYDDITLVILKWYKKNNIVGLDKFPVPEKMEMDNGRI